jgi:hypothetical protein
VEDDEDAICGRVHVGLEIAVAEPDGPVEGGHRVLSPVERPTAVGDRERPVVLEERMNH